MKKRIISLILVVAMLLVTLCSCSYNYAKKDLTKYASFDKAAFETALKSIVIEDEDFGTDEDARKLKVLDNIYAALAKASTKDSHKTEGIPTGYDAVYFCYYVTAVIDEVEHTFFTDTMNPDKPSNAQLGLSSNEDLALAFVEFFADKDITDFIYSASTKGNAAAGDTLYITYTRTYSVPVEGEINEDGSQLYKEITETYKCVSVDLPELADAPADDSTEDGEPEGDTNTDEPSVAADEPDSGENDKDTEDKGEEPAPVKSFLEMLVGKKVGKVDKYTVDEEVDGETVKVSYTDIQIHWIVESGESVGSFTDTTYTEDKKVKDTLNKEYNLKDRELTYHVFPVYYVDVADKITAEVVLYHLLGNDADADGTVESSELGTIELFDSKDYKNGNDTLESLIDELTTELGKLVKAKKTAEKEADKKDEDKKDESTEGEDKKEETKKDPVAEAQEKVDELVKKILGCTYVGEDKDAEAIADAIVNGYNESVYDNLESAYKSAILESIAKEVFKLAQKYVTYEKNEDGTYKLPKSAVREAYKRIENLHKYNFYEGKYTSSSSSSSSTSSSSVTNYEYYGGDYERYLKVAVGLTSTATMQQVHDKIGLQAETAVRELILVYLLADVYDLPLTKDEKSQNENSLYVVYFGYDAEDLNHSTQFDKVMNHLLEEKDEDDYAEDAVYGENKVQYVRITYTFKEEKDEVADK